MLRSSIVCLVLSATGATLAAQQTNVPFMSLSPFVALGPSQGTTTMAGLSLSLGSGPFALRAGGHVSLQERNSAMPAGGTTRPWGADADALAFLSSSDDTRRGTFVPYMLVGVGTVATDSNALRVVHPDWSYGGGLATSLGASIGAFAEARWRMNRFVMPNASNSPSPTHEFRFGLNFRIGGQSAVPDVFKVIGTASDVLSSSGVYDIIAQILSTANQFVGSPYRSGGMSPSGFDAAGFVRYVFSRFGVTLPRDPRDQALVGDPVRADVRSLQPGDLVMFQDGAGIMHVAIYVGRSQIIHSSETGGGVLYDDLNSERGRWFLSHIAAARRVTPDARGSHVDLSQGYPNMNYDERPDRAPRPMRRRNDG